MTRLADAKAKYHAAADLRVTRLVVDDPVVQKVCAAVSTLVARVDDRGRPSIWAETRNAAAALRWLLLTRPLGRHDEPGGMSVALRILRAQARRLDERVEPALLEQLRQVVEVAGKLDEAEDLLGDSIAATARDTDGRVCVVSAGVSACQETQRALSGCLPGVAFLGPRQFLSGPIWGRAVVVGISSWFADELFTAPRCTEIALVHHSWLRDRSTVAGLFSRAGGTGIQLVLPAQATTNAASENIRPPTETIDWSGVEPVGGKPQDSDPSDDVPAHLVVLAGGYGFYLEADAHTIRGIDPAGSAGCWVRQLPTSELGAGSIVMLRKGVSERDTLRPRIDAILGEEGDAVRECQAQWKGALRRRLAEGGLEALQRALDMPRLTLAYALYWASKNCISPRQPAFRSLLGHLGVEDVQMFLSSARKLYSAHHKAGQQLVRELGYGVDDTVIHRLETDDSVTLSVGRGVNALQITLFKVVAISPETTTVPAAALRTALKLRGAEWLA